jgi:hypothetical protein
MIIWALIMKLQAGKTYKLIDKDGYLRYNKFNQGLIDYYFKDGSVTLDMVIKGRGFLDSKDVITLGEIKFFEECESKNNSEDLDPLALELSCILSEIEAAMESLDRLKSKVEQVYKSLG